MQIRDLIPWNRDRREATRATHEDDNPVVALQRDLNRVFDNFWSRFDRPLMSGNGALAGFGPSTDITEADKAVEVSVELPGLDEKDVEVSLTGDYLTIRGEKQAERSDNGRGYYLTERSYGAFYRSIPLPPGVDPDQATAEFKRGVLKVSLPKTPKAQSRVKKIDVKAA